MICMKCKTAMTAGAVRGQMTEYVCPVCGYRTLAPKEAPAQRPRLPERVETPPMKAAEPPSPPPKPVPTQTTQKRRSKSISKKTERPAPDPLLADLRGTLKQIKAELGAMEVLVNREIRALGERIAEIESKLPSRENESKS
jgi:hypothetical protein